MAETSGVYERAGLNDHDAGTLLNSPGFRFARVCGSVATFPLRSLRPRDMTRCKKAIKPLRFERSGLIALGELRV